MLPGFHNDSGRADEKRKIGLCFSSSADRRLVSEHLSDKGYEVIECPVAADTEIDLIIMDTAFARRSGREALGLKKPGGVFLPVVIALGPKDDPAVWLSAGFDLCLRMPFSKAELDAAAQTLLRLRRQSEQLLQRVENIYQSIFEATGTATLIVEQDGAIVMANKECLAVTGYAPEELIGKKWMEFATPESLDMMLAYHALRRKDPSLAPKKYEAKLINKKGGPRYAVLDVNMIPGATRSVVSMMDVTERKKAEAALKESTADLRRLSDEFHALLDAIPDNLTLQDENLKVVWANKGAAAGLGKNVSDLVGNYCYKLWYGKNEPCDPCPVQKSFRTGEPAAETVTTPDGRIWDLRTIPIKESGRVVNVIEMGRDITEHRRLEEQLIHAQKLEGIGQLAGGIAHDFNNVLNAVVGFAGLLQMKIASEDPLKHYVDEIMTAGQRGAMLTHQILAFSRKQVLDMKPADLNEIIRSLEKMLRRLVREDISIELKLFDKDLVVMADASQIDQVVINLVTNARDAMPKGGSIGISTDHFVMDNEYIRMHGYGSPGEYACFTVSDTGCGMDEETQKRIFEPFFTTKEVGKGTGLGLAVVHGIVKQHNGYINVYSEVGKGSIFRIYLPLTEGVVRGTEDKQEAQIRGGTETILIAEDDDSLRKLSRTVLQHYGYKVIEAVDGDDAVRKFSEYRKEINMVILDGIMPRKTGKEAFDEIRRLSPDMKAIFMSGYSEDIFSHDGIPDKGALFIQKPVTPHNLIRMVRETLDRAEQST